MTIAHAPAAEAVTSYRDLIAWQRAMALVCLTYEQTALLPTDERFGLISQMRRCAVSIPSNIAEGWGRRSTDEYLRFLMISCGSVHELSTQAEICSSLNYSGEWNRLLDGCQECGRIINGLITAKKRRKEAAPPKTKG